MKSFSVAVLLCLAVSSVGAFTAPVTPTALRKTSTGLASSVQAMPFTKGPRIVMDDLPTVYVYDHCPFCVRVRLAFGIKNIKHNVRFMANDDIKTPTALVGKKIAPIFVSISCRRRPCRRMRIQLSTLQHHSHITLFISHTHTQTNTME